MIILDTNVVSEIAKSRPDKHVVRWIESIEEPVTTSITVQELYFGAESLPIGRRRQDLIAYIEDAINSLTGVLPYNDPAARQTAILLAKFKKAGINLSGSEDAQIAGIALANDLPVATRNTKDFKAAGVRIINPWASE